LDGGLGNYFSVYHAAEDWEEVLWEVGWSSNSCALVLVMWVISHAAHLEYRTSTTRMMSMDVAVAWSVNSAIFKNGACILPLITLSVFFLCCIPRS
jgi:hypothetical protein